MTKHTPSLKFGTTASMPTLNGAWRASNISLGTFSEKFFVKGRRKVHLITVFKKYVHPEIQKNFSWQTKKIYPVVELHAVETKGRKIFLRYSGRRLM